ncbi:MAG: helix-turn-helix domain-containing protein [Lachnospiraceae bacterium]|nr:helix-turn-helix domain-containing protein [Lachnospiraceae bacterium]
MLEDYPDILTPKEVMEILGISKNTLYQLINNGEIPATRLGRKLWRIQKQALMEFLEKR